jgi:glyoxylase-like metal-dependent hydrolase (beta-lactamase superfamily II)
MIRATRIAVLLALLCLAASVVFADSAHFSVVPVTSGVYAVLGKNGPNNNAAFIVNDDDVVVIDTHTRPSWAREVIGEIRKITDKPVRYVINTHWHEDHVQGNQAYIAAFGNGVTVIQQDLTREDMLKYLPDGLVQAKATDTPRDIARMEQLLSDEKDAEGKPLTDKTRLDLQRQLDSRKAYLAEIPDIHLVPGDITFGRSLTLHESGRDIELHYFGYAHTRGDTIVYLPKDKVVITGDVLESQVPMMSSAYPVKWISVLTALQQLDWDYAVPGHGGVQQGKQTLTQFAAYLTDLVSTVRESVAKGMTQEQVMKSVDMRKYDQMPHYADRNPDAIERTYLEVTGKVPD